MARPSFLFLSKPFPFLSIEEACYDDGHFMSPTQWYTALSAYMYKRRSKMDPLWNSHIVAGVDKKSGER